MGTTGARGAIRSQPPRDRPRVLLITAVAGAATVLALKLISLALLLLGRQVAWVPPGRLSDEFEMWLIAAWIVLVLAVVVAGAAALILHARGHRRWFALAAIAVVGTPAMSLALVGLYLRSYTNDLSPLLLLGGLAILIAPVAAAATIPVPSTPVPGGWRWHLAGVAVWVPLVLVVGGLAFASSQA